MLSFHIYGFLHTELRWVNLVSWVEHDHEAYLTLSERVSQEGSAEEDGDDTIPS